MDVGLVVPLAYRLTYRRPIHLRHHPIEQGQSRRVGQGQLLQREAAIVDGDDFIALALESLLEQAAGYGLIVGNQNLHSWAPAVTFMAGGLRRRARARARDD